MDCAFGDPGVDGVRAGALHWLLPSLVCLKGSLDHFGHRDVRRFGVCRDAVVRQALNGELSVALAPFPTVIPVTPIRLYPGRHTGKGF